MRMVIENAREGLSRQTDEAGLVRLPSDNAAHFLLSYSHSLLSSLALLFFHLPDMRAR